MFPSAPIRLSRCAIVLSSLAILLAGTTAFAESTWDVQVPFQSTGDLATLDSPRGVAVAPDGTVYATDIRSTTSGRVLSITPAGTVGGTSGGTASLTATVALLTVTVGGTTPTVRPNAVAVDSLGDLYIADSSRHRVYELTSPETSGAATELTYAGTGPTALATDSSNNLYVADTNGSIYKFVGGVGTALPIGSSAYQPVGLAVDSAGDVFFASAANNYIYKYTPGSAATVFLTDSSAGVPFQFSTGNAQTSGLPVGMGFDPAGNLYVLDAGSTDLWQINPVAPVTIHQVPFSAATTVPGSLAVSNVGNLYISDDSNVGTVKPSVAELFYNNNPVNLGVLKAGTNSPLLNANYDFYTADTSIAEYQVVNGDYTGEFKIVSSSGPGCTGTVGVCNGQVEANYLVADPGLRNGVVGVIDAAKNIMVVHIVGVSEAASLALYPGAQSALSATSSQTIYEPQGAAVTGDGRTFFLADEGGINLSSGNPTYPYPAVYAFTVSGGVPAGAPTTVGSFTTPIAVALDAFGNLYVADYSGFVTKFPPTYNTSSGATSWSGFGTRLTFPTGITLNHPISLAVDIYNNLYIGDAGPGSGNATSTNPGYIVEVPGDGGPATQLNYVIGGIPVIFPDGLTTDSYGNLYIADVGDGIVSDGSVDVVPVAAGQAPYTIDFGNFAPINGAGSVAFDAAGDLYVVDSYNSRILTVPFTYAGTVPTAVTADVTLLGGNPGISGLSNVATPASIVVWPNQNTITVTDIGYQPPTGTPYPVQVLTLTGQSVTAPVSSITNSAVFTGINVGNEQITFESPTSTGNTGDFTLSGCGSTAGNTLAPGLTATPPCTTTIQSNGTTGSGVVYTLHGNPTDDGSGLGNTITVAGPPVGPEPIAQLTPISATSTTSGTGTAILENIGGGTLTISGIIPVAGSTTVGANACSTTTALTNLQTCTITYVVPTPSPTQPPCNGFHLGNCTVTNTMTLTVNSNGTDGTASLTGTYTYSVTNFCFFVCSLDRTAGSGLGGSFGLTPSASSDSPSSFGFSGLTF